MSTLTSKGQATISAEVRKKLELHAGDKIMFEVIDHHVILKKAQPFDYHYHAALSQTRSEWDSPEDEEACSDL